MTRYELKTIASHHRDWLKGEKEGIAADLSAARLSEDSVEIMRNRRPSSLPRTQRPEQPLSLVREGP
jgi:hypothetical protein